MSAIAIEETLFTLDDRIANKREKTRSYISDKLLGPVRREDDDLLETVVVYATAAKGLAKTIARSRGDVDPESEVFHTRSIIGRLNQGEDDTFKFDLNHEFVGMVEIDEVYVNSLEERAYRMAMTLVLEQKQQQLWAELVNN